MPDQATPPNGPPAFARVVRWCWQLLRWLAGEIAVRSRPVFRFYWSQRGQFRDYLGEYFKDFRDLDDQRKEIRLTEREERGKFERTETGWSVKLPKCCVVCGDKPTGEKFSEKSDLADLYWPLRAPLIGLGSGLLSWLLFGSYLAVVLFPIIGLSAGYALRRTRSAQIKFRRCSEHLVSDLPQLRWFEDTLIVRTGHASVRKRFFAPDKFVPVQDLPPVSPKPRPDQAPIKLAEQTSATVIHDVQPALGSVNRELPREPSPPPEQPQLTEDATLPQPADVESKELSGSDPALQKESQPANSLYDLQDRELAVAKPISRGDGDRQSTEIVEAETTLRSILSTPFRRDVVSATVSITGLILLTNLGLLIGTSIGAVYFIPELLFWFIGLILVFGILVVSSFFLGSMFEVTWIVVLTRSVVWGFGVTYFTVFAAGTGAPILVGVAVVWNLALMVRLAALFAGTTFGTVRAFESGNLSVDPEDGSILDVVALITLTLLTLIMIPAGAFVATRMILVTTSVLSSFDQIWTTLPALTMAVGAGLILGLYHPIAIAVFGAYRTLNPFVALKAAVVAFPKVFPAMAFSQLHQVLIAGFALVTLDQIILPSAVSVGGDIVGAIILPPTNDLAGFMRINSPMSIFDLVVICGSVLALFALCHVVWFSLASHALLSQSSMLGLALRRYRYRVAPRQFRAEMDHVRYAPIAWLLEAVGGFVAGCLFLAITWLLIMCLLALVPHSNYFNQLFESINAMQSNLDRLR